MQQIGEGRVQVGERCSIGAGASVVFQKPATITLGDYCTIGAGVKFVVAGDVRIGDWASLHDNCLLLSTAGLHMGDHCWFGQNSVIDGTGGMTIGHGVRVGMFSQLWSHAAAGERIEGCTLFAERPVTIGDHVWLVGSCIVASGVTLGERLVALIGSNITKSFGSDIVIAGTPAQERLGLSFYRSIDLDEKMVMLNEWLDEAARELGYRMETIEPGAQLCVHNPAAKQDGRVIFVRDDKAAGHAIAEHPDATVCCIDTKLYTKQLTQVEWRTLKYLSGNKARFFADVRR